MWRRFLPQESQTYHIQILKVLGCLTILVRWGEVYIRDMKPFRIKTGGVRKPKNLWRRCYTVQFSQQLVSQRHWETSSCWSIAQCNGSLAIFLLRVASLLFVMHCSSLQCHCTVYRPSSNFPRGTFHTSLPRSRSFCRHVRIPTRSSGCCTEPDIPFRLINQSRLGSQKPGTFRSKSKQDGIVRWRFRDSS